MGEPVNVDLTPQQEQELTQFCSTPVFQHLRMQAIQQPSIVPQLLMLINQSNPNIGELLRSNPQLMVHLLIHGSMEGINQGGSEGNLPANPAPGGTTAPGPAPLQPPTPNTQQPIPPVQQPVQPVQPQPQVTIQLSEEDRVNVETIIGYGFTNNQAIEAYLVCNKNVELAINYLFDQQG